MFYLTRTFDLESFSSDWKGCFLTFREPTVGELRQIAKMEKKDLDALITVMESLFVNGKAFDGKAVVDMKATELSELPITIIRGAIDFLLMGIQSGTTTSE